MRKKLLLTGTVIALAIASVLILYLASAEVNRHGGFDRTYAKGSLIIKNIIPFKNRWYYIAGDTKDKILIGNYANPDGLWVYDATSNDSSYISISYSSSVPKLTGRISIDTLRFFVTAGQNYTVLSGSLSDFHVDEVNFTEQFFADAIALSRHTLVVKTWNDDQSELVLGKRDPSMLSLFPGLLERQIDGVFCTDGMLNYNRTANMLIYVYYYRNQYICMDTSMNLLYRANTVDTVSRAHISTGNIKSESAMSLASPARYVNKQSYSYNRWLFINSNIMAENESRSEFSKQSVIDAYDLQGGTYKVSFSIPFYESKPMREFRVNKRNLIVLYDHALIVYEIPSPLKALLF